MFAELSLKRKTSDSTIGPPAKQQKTIYPAYFIPELAHVVAMCDEKLPFVCLARELSKRKIPHSGLQVEANATSLVLKLLSLPLLGSQQVTPENKVNNIGTVILGFISNFVFDFIRLIQRQLLTKVFGMH